MFLLFRIKLQKMIGYFVQAVIQTTSSSVCLTSPTKNMQKPSQCRVNTPRTTNRSLGRSVWTGSQGIQNYLNHVKRSPIVSVNNNENTAPSIYFSLRWFFIYRYYVSTCISKTWSLLIRVRRFRRRCMRRRLLLIKKLSALSQYPKF